MSKPHQASKRPERPYRHAVRTHLNKQGVIVQQTDLIIYSDGNIDADVLRDAVIEQRGYLEAYIEQHPDFLHAFEPLPDDPLAPAIVRKMLAAGRASRVGPMAAVAGAMAEAVGGRLLRNARELIVENGGDIFLHVARPVTIGVFAGRSPLNLKLGLRVIPDSETRAVCTSSGTIGHSVSFGKADAVCTLSHSCALADAAATAIGNRVASPRDFRPAIDWGKRIEGIHGILIIQADKMAAWGQIEIAPL